MALHFERTEFDARRDRLMIEMAEKKLDAVVLFAQESMYWLTGYDTFGFCFFQSLVVMADGSMTLLTRSADLRQARHTSIIENIVLWTDRDNANPTLDLRNLLNDLGLLGARVGVEYDTHGLTAFNGRRLDEQLQTFGQIVDASGIVGRLRLFKSPAEIEKAEKAASLADDALDAALPLIKQGGDEARILAAMQGAIFTGGGDYPANEFIIGSGADALLCRYKSGRRKLNKNDQLTLEWAGVFNHYHAPMMRTVLTGKASRRHQELYDASLAALLAVEKAMTPGNTFGDVFDAHARTLEAHDLTKHRLNACGYSVGARFTPSWMDMPMFYQGNPEPIAPNMTLFAHMIIMDSETETAMTLGRTYLTTESAPKPLSRHDLDLIVR
ncbi:Xaa-Pro peptidase family protein [Aminobacter sp. NyZ550]|jgi:Xaa-Pro dipeptidase|uniref:Xaa-Pro dipeptidase n=2 Tax=Aminobacter TaxID=31988 RepID=A0AAC8YNG4_AMIAI|nr:MULTISPECIES: Xaa-Pro peptidase family protein [Aminobacter]AMS41351.1 Xaa-Pro dipeptidase [Aminobacter aminovorans]MBA8904582.1 Xaa-Pro dipeptidase [Aminobacter ciceronei]MBA9018360.1 Xaa-Pro dipeptidase [Aminobacter ciceronei]MBB3707918.1 Xaa-Pro dipeptidase [Aminobacter aminovorans]QOF70560.1 aminopeptidase P family protein [Aminobacter sp. SR38]